MTRLDVIIKYGKQYSNIVKIIAKIPKIFRNGIASICGKIHAAIVLNECIINKIDPDGIIYDICRQAANLLAYDQRS